MYTLLGRRRVVSATGVVRLEYHGRHLDGVALDWVSEAESLNSFTSLQLDTFHAMWNSTTREAGEVGRRPRTKGRRSEHR